MQLTHELGQYLQLAQRNCQQPIWRYVYGGKPKPYFHPLCTPAGFVLTNFEPHDHLWHRGLWFAIKYINGENFWEEDPGQPWGTQITAAPPDIQHLADGGFTFISNLRWARPGNAGDVFAERRQITYIPMESSYALDFIFDLTALAQLKLDRTVYTTWGGYGGLTLRGNRNWQETRLLFSTGQTSDRPTGIPADWGDLSGKLDGGANATGGIAIFDHPANRRHPTPWYGGTGAGHYFNAAFLFHEPMTLAAEEKLTLRYRVLVHDGIYDQSTLQLRYGDYCNAAI